MPMATMPIITGSVISSQAVTAPLRMHRGWIKERTNIPVALLALDAGVRSITHGHLRRALQTNTSHQEQFWGPLVGDRDPNAIGHALVGSRHGHGVFARRVPIH